MLKTAITSIRAVVVMVRTNRSQGLLVTTVREEVGNQVKEQKDPFLACCKETKGRIRKKIMREINGEADVRHKSHLAVQPKYATRIKSPDFQKDCSSEETC